MMTHLACHAVDIAPADLGPDNAQWIHILPNGEFSGRDGRGPWRVVNPTKIIEASLAYAANRPIPVDYDHHIDLVKTSGAQAIAAGWIEKLEARPDGVWGLVKWTAKAIAHLAAKEYRFLSPVFTTSKKGELLCVMRAALTNNPAINELKAVVASEVNQMEALLQKLREALGLDQSALEEDVLAAIATKTKPQAGNPDPAKFVPMEEFQRVVKELNRLNTGIERAAAESHVDLQIEKGRLPPYLKSWGIELCTANKPAFDEFVDYTKKLYAPLFKQIVPSSYPPTSELVTASALTESERQAASLMGLTEAEFQRAKRLGNN